MTEMHQRGSIIEQIIANAKERAFEILLQAEKEVEKEYWKIVQTKVNHINQEISKKMHANCEKMRVRYSSLINAHKMHRLKYKHTLCQQIFIQVEQIIHQSPSKDIHHQNNQQPILKAMIQEGLIRMFEPVVYIRCLQRDSLLIQKIIPECMDDYNQIMVELVGKEYPTKIILSKQFMAEKSSQEIKQTDKNSEEQMCIGGIILTDETGRIVFKNTFDCRINILKQHFLPVIRNLLWGNRVEQVKISTPNIAQPTGVMFDLTDLKQLFTYDKSKGKNQRDQPKDQHFILLQKLLIANG